MDRRNFLKDLGILGLEALLLPKGRSMVGWTRSVESGLYLHKEYGMGFTITQELLEDSLYGNIVTIQNNLIRLVQPTYNLDAFEAEFPQWSPSFHRETPKRLL